MLSALFVVCLAVIIGEVLLGIVRRTHRQTLASYGIDVEQTIRPHSYREHGEGTIRDYLVLGDELLVELDVHRVRRGHPISRWARCDASAQADAQLRKWRTHESTITIDDRNGFITLHCAHERVQVMALAQPPVTTA